MSDRDGYRHGVPCWVDLLQDDPDGAAAFYAELLGWEVEERTAGPAEGRYLVGRLRGRDVAAVGSPPPAGAVLRAWEPGAHRGAGVVNEAGAWSMSALRTSDPEAATRFYGAVFGWETESFGPATMWRLPGYVGGEPTQPVPRDVVAVMLPADDVAPHWGVDFWVHDADATAARAVELGGSVPVPPYDAPPFRQAVVAVGRGRCCP